MDDLRNIKSGSKVLLLNHPVSDTALSEKMNMLSRTEPFGLLRLGTYFRQKDCQVQMLDCMQDPALEGRLRRHFRKKLPCGSGEDGMTRAIYHYGLSSDLIAKRLTEFDEPDIIALSAVFTWHADVLKETIQTCKSVYPNAKVVIGGNFPTICPREAGTLGADLVCRGDLVEARFLPTAVDLSPGVVTEDVVSMIKGCPFKCSYCITNFLNDGNVYTRPPEDVYREMIEKRDKYGIKSFLIYDDFVMYQQQKFLDPLLDMLIQDNSGINLQFVLGFSAHLITDEFASRLKRAGVQKVEIALETINVHRSQSMNRPHHMEKFIRAVEILKSFGYRENNFRVYCIMGLPGQTLQEILLTICFLYGLEICPTLTTYTMIPGTGDMDKYKDLIKWKNLDELSPCLWRFASPRMKVEDLETVYTYFHEKYFPIERIANSQTDDPIIVAMQSIIRKKKHLLKNFL